MAVAYVTSANSSALDQTDVSSLTIAITPSGSDLYMVVVTGAWDASTTDNAVSTVTFNGSGTGWSSLNTEVGPGAGTNRAALWGKADPAAVAANCVITFGGTVSEVGACVVVASGASDTPGTAVDAELAADWDIALTIGDAVAGDLLVYGGYIGSNASPQAEVDPGVNQTERADTAITTASTMFCDTQLGADGTAMTGTFVNGGNESVTEWVVVGVAIKAATATAALTGTATASITEADVVTGGKTIILTLTGDTYVAAGTGPIGSIANTTDLINGIDSGQAEATGWDTVVKADLITNLATAVVRTSATVCTITLPASATYNITAQETITATIPAAVLTLAAPIVASPTFTVDIVAAGAKSYYYQANQ